jgi:hypothetical protein
LLTAGFDSEKETRERLFRDIQPDEFYPVYGDSATKGYDAQSTGRLYVRIDKKKCYLLYGDFITASQSEARSLGNYSRSLTGIREHYEKSRIAANLWASHDSSRQIIEEVPANGTSGPYFFRIANGIVNSEKVEIITRDRDQQAIILQSVPMSRFTDYEFEPFSGRILFKAPVASLDPNLNPFPFASLTKWTRAETSFGSTAPMRRPRQHPGSKSAEPPCAMRIHWATTDSTARTPR